MEWMGTCLRNRQAIAEERSMAGIRILRSNSITCITTYDLLLPPSTTTNTTNPRPPTPPLKLPRILPRHPRLIPRPLSPFPKPRRTLLPHKHTMTKRTILGPIILLPRAEPADHAIGVFVRVLDVLRVGVVAFVARVDARAAAEAEPAVGFAVMRAAP